MKNIRNISLKWKLKWIITLTSTVSLCLAATAFFLRDLKETQDSTLKELSTLAQVLASHSEAALAFEDRDTAEETLEALSANPDIVYACIFNAQGKVFAQYPVDSSFLPPVPREKGQIV